jgi:hypothetical protein
MAQRLGTAVPPRKYLLRCGAFSPTNAINEGLKVRISGICSPRMAEYFQRKNGFVLFLPPNPLFSQK